MLRYQDGRSEESSAMSSRFKKYDGVIWYSLDNSLIVRMRSIPALTLSVTSEKGPRKL